MRFLATLALALALITGFSGAKAQTYFREGTTQWLDHSSGSATATTTAIGAQYSHVRLVSTTAVYYALALSGSTVEDQLAAVDQTTASYLPANVERILKVSSGQVVVAVSASTSGILTVTTLSQ